LFIPFEMKAKKVAVRVIDAVSWNSPAEKWYPA
jgi:hypothetical protein